MTDIDWSKAPEGATHYMESPLRWRKVVDDQAFGFADGKWQMIDLPEIRKYTEIESSWSGKGIPPVGTICEYRSPDTCAPKDWTVVHVLAHARHDVDQAVLMAEDYFGKHGTMYGRIYRSDCFRPIRTPKQIAAEEREKAILAMVSGPLSGRISSWECAEALYDAGYRKAEGGAE